MISDLPCPTLGLNLSATQMGLEWSLMIHTVWRGGYLRTATERDWGPIPECPKGVISVAVQGVV